jgi:4-carboxymuconolactone decarboxylase
MSRLRLITIDRFNEAQQMFFDHITKGKRGRDQSGDSYLTPEGGLRGPFGAWLYCPALGDAAQRLGESVRFEASLHPVLRELAILTVAARWRCSYEWWGHEQIAKSVGLSEEVRIPLREGNPPKFRDHQESIVYEFTRELIDTCRISDHLYENAVASLGEQGVVELVILIGYYTMVAMTINVFKVPIPAGEDFDIRK